MIDTSVLMVSGALVLGYVVCALFFTRYWQQSRDRLFLFFAGAFALLALQRLLLSMVEGTGTLVLYGVRALAFSLILIAIIDKNRR
jgi:hypothetical protein